MPEVIYYVAASLDGFIADTDGRVDWLEPFQQPDEDYGYAAFYASVDGLILGRRTYEQALSFGDWPYPGKPCRVLTHRPLRHPPAGVAAAAGAPAEILADLAALGLKRLWLVGGAEAFQAFRTAGLVSSYIITVMPLLLGAGVALFPAPGPREALRLCAAQVLTQGVTQLHYKRP